MPARHNEASPRGVLEKRVGYALEVMHGESS